MRIAIVHHGEDVLNDYGAYLSNMLEAAIVSKDYIVKDYHQLNRFRDPLTSSNVLLHVVVPASGKFELNYWYSIKLPRILKKYRVDYVLCNYGISISTHVPQVLVISDISLLSPQIYNSSWQVYAAKKLKKSMAIAENIVTYSASAQKKLAHQNATLIPYTANELFQPLEWHDKLYIKSRFAENKEYFLSVLPDDDEKIFVELLKAFSKFKKWQQSSMQLLLLPKDNTFSRTIENKLSTYKYRDDIKLVNDADEKETAQIIASAYVYVHASKNDADLLPVIIALQCALPVIGFYNESIEEYCGAAAKLAKEHNHEALGEELILIYKDETLRTKMSEAATHRAAAYKQPEAMDALCKLLKI